MGKTVAIIDFAHSGTTMIAGILEILGVPMVGERYRPMKWEDLDIVEALADDEQFGALVAQRNEQHDVWGFKRPGAWLWVDTMRNHLRDPVYLAIYKDPVSVTRRRFGSSDARWPRKIKNTFRQMKRSIDGIYACGLEVHTLSYLKAITDPLAFIGELAQMVDIVPSQEEVVWAANYIQPNTGKARKHYPSVEEALQDG